MKKFFLLLLVGCISLIFISTASADIWAKNVSTGSGWFDAEKDTTNTEDDLLCWAAAAANILAWSGWDGGFADEDAIFDELEAQDPVDSGGWMNYAWQFWFDGTQQGGHFGGSTHTGYYSTAEYTANYFSGMNTSNAMTMSEDLLSRDYGVAFGIFGPVAHAITLWGIDKDDQGNYLGVWVTDSDNNKGGPDPRPDTLDYYTIRWDGSHWFFNNMYGYNSIYIDDIQALKYLEDVPDPDAVPEPATMLLFGLGLLGLAGVNRRKS